MTKLDNTAKPVLSRGLFNNGFLVLKRGLVIPLLPIVWLAYVLRTLMVSTVGGLMIIGNSHAQLDTTTQDWVPLHLRGANAFPAPTALAEFAAKNGGRHILFIDDKIKCDRSIRSWGDIFINTRATYWDAMIQPPWQCKSPAEAILQRFLHELGHIVDRSPGDSSLVSTRDGLIITKPNGIWAALVEPKEKVAWDFAFTVRDRTPEIYRHLLESVEKWYASHQYSEKDWDDLPGTQWKRITGQNLPADPWSLVPEAIRRQYQPK